MGDTIYHRFTHFPALAISAHNNDIPRSLIFGPKPTTLSSTWMRRRCSWTFARQLWPQSPTLAADLVVVAVAVAAIVPLGLHLRSLWSSLSSRVVKSLAVLPTMSYLAYPNRYLSWALLRLNLRV